MTYTTVAKVRTATGVTSSLVSDDDITTTINQSDAATDRLLNSSFTMKTAIETVDGNGTDTIATERSPVGRLITLKIDGTAITVNNVFVYPKSGILRLSTDAETSFFKDHEPHLISYKYTFGRMEESTTETTTSDAETAGTAVTIGLASVSGLAANDFIRIHSTDGKDEITQITSVGASSIIAPLSQSHEASSRVVLMQTPVMAVRLSTIVAGQMIISRVVGSSFDEITGYSMPEISVQKGEPYTQWREAWLRMQDEREQILATFRPSLSVAS